MRQMTQLMDMQRGWAGKGLNCKTISVCVEGKVQARQRKPQNGKAAGSKVNYSMGDASLLSIHSFPILTSQNLHTQGQ